jgi:membrane protein DedA with SNARE-associated domain
MDFLTNFIAEYGLIAMFLIILLEYACFPVSSEIVLPFSGAIACSQRIPFAVILTASVIAGLIGTTICYAVGSYGGTAIMNRLMNRFPKSQKGITRSYSTFQSYGSCAVCFARVIPICRTYIAFISGTMKQRYPIFLIASFIGITVWNTVLIGLGYFLKDNWELAFSYYAQYKHRIIPVVAAIIGIFVIKAIRTRIRRKSESE